MLIRRLVLTALSTALMILPARAENTRVTYPDAVGVEALGRGLTFSAQYDRVISEDLAAGAGFGRTTVDLGGGISGPTVTTIPFYVNWYFNRDQGSLFATAGGTIVSDSSAIQGLQAKFSDVRFSDSPLLGTFGVGYENRGENGFLFRVNVYGIAGETLVPWVGFTLGHSF